MSKAVQEVNEEDLPEPFRDGLTALRRAHPHQDIEPLIVHGNMVVVQLGSFDVTGPRFDEDRSGKDLEYVHDVYTVYARIVRSFPDQWSGNNAKGFGTSPPLERANHGLQNNPNWEPEVQSPLEQYLDDPVEMYSWNWEGPPVSQPADMKYAYDLAEQMLIHG